MKTYSKLLVSSTIFSLCISCGGSGGDVLKSLLCGRGSTHKSKMTVGLDLDSIRESLSLAQTETVSDDSVKGFLNSALEAVSIPTESFNVKSVKSVIEGDTVRFLELGGAFGEAFGIASGYIKDAFAEAKGLDFVQESFGVRATTVDDIYRKRKVTEFFEEYAPFLLTAESYHKYQWAYDQTNYSGAKVLYEKMLTKAGVDKNTNPVVVAVLDTGVDLNHPDLIDVLYKDSNGKVIGYDAIEGKSVQDGNGHGTHCAGIIAAEKKSANSPEGVARMGNIKIMPVKVLGEGGSGGFQEIEKGVRWAVDKGADVISMSLGAGLENKDVEKEKGKIINRVFSEAIDKNTIVVVAAGNESCPLGGSCKGTGLFSASFTSYTVLPCAYDGTICVGATNQDETLAEYSNFWSEKKEDYRTQADVNAPGTAIYSTWPTQLDDRSGYKAISGTSMATPYVAGVAALIKTVVPNITQKEMKTILERSQAFSDDIKGKSNTGRVDLYTALQIVAKEKLGMTEENPTEPPAAKKVTSAPEQNAGGGSIDIVSALWGTVCAVTD